MFENWNNISHRGLHDEKIPENSMKAFKNAIKEEYAIELDLHILKDNNVVVFHDDNLKRMTGINKLIKDCTYEELKKYNLKNSKEKIPLFKDALKEINGKVPILIELKYDRRVGLLEKETIKILKDYTGIYYFQSFRLRTVRYVNKYSNVKSGLLIHSKGKFDLLLNKFIFKIFKVDFISYPIKRLPNKKIEKLHNKIPILFWVYKNNKNKEYIKKYSDKIIFEKK